MYIIYTIYILVVHIYICEIMYAIIPFEVNMVELVKRRSKNPVHVGFEDVSPNSKLLFLSTFFMTLLQVTDRVKVVLSENITKRHVVT